jgi:type IV pilus assembly protein PilQ
LANFTKVQIPLTQNEYKGTPISVDFQNADLHAVFRLLAKTGGINIIVSEKVKGRVTLKVEEVPWDLLFDAILANYGLAKIKIGNIIKIVTLEELKKEMDLYKDYVKSIAESNEALKTEIEAKRDIFQAWQELREKKNILITKTYKLKYIRAGKFIDLLKKQTLSDKLKKLFKEPNKITEDPLTNTLIVKATQKILNELDRIIKEIDKPRPQILIEARIVEINESYVHNLGIKWGGAAWKAGAHSIWGVSANPSFTPGATSYNYPGGGLNTGSATITFSSPTAVDLGIPEPTSSLGILLGYFGDTAAILDMQLSALEQEGAGRIISKPTILTLDQETAEIQQGYKIPYLKLAANLQKASTDFIDVGLKLKVTPCLTAGGKILLDISIEKSTPDWTHTVNGIPALSTSTIQTSALVDNRETLVLGGIKIKDISETVDKVSGLAKIPILGEIFKRKEKNLSDKELLIFITPKIVYIPIAGIDY